MADLDNNLPRPTMKDVAEKAQVSVSTVSFVLSGKGNISPEVRKKVHRAVEDLGYKKNIFAAAVAAGKSSNIAILINEDYEKAFEWNFVRNIFIQLEAVITGAGYFPLFLTVSRNTKTKVIFNKIASSGIGALFSIHYGNQGLFTLLNDHSIPVVVLNNADYQHTCYTVCSDDYQGAYEGTLHLIGLGHRDIAFFDYHRPDFKQCFRDRFIGFQKALDEYEIVFRPQWRITITLQDKEELKEKTTSLFRGQIKPSALFVHDDYMAAKIMMILQALDIQVPRDVSIIAPGDTLDYNHEYVPRITTMRIDTELIGKLAGELMLRILNNTFKAQQSLKIRQQLVERGSCRKLESAHPAEEPRFADS
jgi:LacI family transcriptional regulator